MITNIRIRDFLSYEKLDLNIGDSSLIALIGDNGSGKSALLETIPYALYGIGRTTINNLSRLGGGGGHQVELSIGIWKIIRGRKNNNLLLEVYKDGSLVSSGSSAQSYIETNITKMNFSSFMLSCFYGLGGNKKSDTLIDVDPLIRLETLQKLANIERYKKYLKYVKTKLSEIKIDISSYKKTLDMSKEFILRDDDVNLLKSKRDDLKNSISKKEEELSLKKKERREFQELEKKYNTLLLQKNSYLREIESLEDKLNDLSDSIELYYEEKSSIKESIDTLIKKRDSLKKELELININEIETKYNELTHEQYELKSMMDLKIQATKEVNLDEISRCPLCGNSLEGDVKDIWKNDIVNLKKEIDKIKSKLSELDSLNKKVVNLESAIKDSEHRISIEKIKYKNSADALKLAKSQFGKIKNEIESKKMTFSKIVSELSSEEFNNVTDNVNSLNILIEDLTTSITLMKSEIISINDKLKKDDKERKTIRKIENELKKAEYNEKIYLTLSKVWSRYGIPLELIKNLYKSIETEATNIYSDFDNTTIRIDEMEYRGKPGIEFKLIDKKGERVYSQLSVGEKVMFFMAIRVALAKILAYQNNVGIEFVVLDEVLANLSQKNRDILIKVINKIRSIYPQIFMVSHTNLWDIFDKIIYINSEYGKSEVKVA